MRKIVRLFPFARFVDLANGVTMVNVMLSFVVPLVAYLGLLSWAASLICLAAILDFVDGHIARTRLAYHERCREFGKHLDSFADLLNFSCAPALLLFLLLPSLMAVIAGAALVLSGVLRLAAFAIKDSNAPVGYSGLPTTYSGLLLALAFQSVSAGRVEAAEVVVLVFIIALLQITNVQFPKFKAMPTVSSIAVVFSISSLLLHYG